MHAVHPLILVGFVAFFVAALVVGVRLLLLWRRTRGLPELLIGLGVLGIGPVGYGFLTVGEALQAQRPGTAQALFAIALFAASAGAFCKFVFNWKVYHPKSAAVRGLVWMAGATFVAAYLLELFSTGFTSPYGLGASFYMRYPLQAGCLLWGALEALLYWRRLRRRLRLGLTDPVVTNRFFMWGVGAGAAGIGSAIGAAAMVVTGKPPLELPWLTVSSSMHGLVAAVALWLAFVPSAAYRRFLESRAAKHAAAI